MNDSTVYVGLDTHKDSNVAAYSIGLGAVQSLGNVGVRERDLDRLCTRLHSKGSRVCFVYEAGPCGYGLYRYLTGKGFARMVCAPSLIARKPGDRVKTDRRDAIMLVKALRMGDLTAVHVPDVVDEAMRDLVRAWGVAKQDLKQARQRLKCKRQPMASCDALAWCATRWAAGCRCRELGWSAAASARR